MTEGPPVPVPAERRTQTRALPLWPITTFFWGTPLWWLLGILDITAIIYGLIMFLLLAATNRVFVPRWFGAALLFLGFVLASVFALPLGGSSLTVWVYRAGLYISAVLLFAYVYNARFHHGERTILRALVGFWITTVVGGFSGVFFPHASFKTPTYYVLHAVAPNVLGNELVTHMATRRLAQDFVGSYLDLSPRPTAPFLFTNNWGNVYSLLTPIVVAILIAAPRRSRGWRFAVVFTALSVIPALLTLNRGMFIGLGLVAAIVALRLAKNRNYKGIVSLTGLGLVVLVFYWVLPVQERLDTRLEGDTTEDRASLYIQAIHVLTKSPILGFGGPLPSQYPNQPPVGSHGQFWMILISHGPLAVIAFVSFFWAMIVRSWARVDAVGMTMNAVLIASLVELGFYGILPYGLPLMATIAALLAASPRTPSGDHDPPLHTRAESGRLPVVR